MPLHHPNPYQTIALSWEPTNRTLHLQLNINPIPCFSLLALNELKTALSSIDSLSLGNTPSCPYVAYLHNLQQPSPGPIHYFVFSSSHPTVFNFGGDLALFSLLSRAKDVPALNAYGSLCLDLLSWIDSAPHRNIYTIALLQGTALGGGLESALPFNTIIAEEQITAGFPETSFNLFPGMGAWQFTTRKTSYAIASHLILSGKILPASELHTLGIFDILCPQNCAHQTLNTFIQSTNPTRLGIIRALQAARLSSPILRSNLDTTVSHWAQCATQLSTRDLRLMDLLARSQLKKIIQKPPPPYTPY